MSDVLVNIIYIMRHYKICPGRSSTEFGQSIARQKSTNQPLHFHTLCPIIPIRTLVDKKDNKDKKDKKLDLWVGFR